MGVGFKFRTTITSTHNPATSKFDSDPFFWFWLEEVLDNYLIFLSYSLKTATFSAAQHMTQLNTPKLFISYSWSNPSHEQWVVDLATEINNSGVEVILDKWDLREGHDSVAFMEKMVTDSSINKVLMICDQTYASKADGRAGGVGTETQIISREVYEMQAQDKFVAVVAEKDAEGKPYLPTYYKSRIYINLSESERYADEFDRLLRWIFDKPLYIKPEIGKPPSFLTESNSPLLGTSTLAKRVLDGFKNDKPYTRGALDEYLSLFAENLEKFRITNTANDQDDLIIKSIEDFTTSRNELISIITTLAQYGDTTSYASRLHRFFETLIPYLDRPAEVTQYCETDFDNFKFIIHELFLYVVAILIKGEHFSAVEQILSQQYFVANKIHHDGSATVSYAVFRQHMNSLQRRNTRLNLRRLSIRADLLEQRSKNTGIPFQQIMQADFICFLRADLIHKNYYENWYPESLLYTIRHYGPFEVFARSISKSYFNRAFPLLGISSIVELKKKLEEYATDRRQLPNWEHQTFNPAGLTGFEKLATLP
jgi:hypothetical protein